MSFHSERYRVGDAEITKVTEQQFALKAATLFGDFDPTVLNLHRHWLTPDHLSADEQSLVLSVHTWVIKWAGKIILVDTACGNHKPRPFSPLFHQLNTPYLQRLAAAGVTPGQVDLVLLTHLHVDHVGWNTYRDGDKWIPTFPHARYVFARAEREFLTSPQGEARRMVFDDSVLPVIQAGLADEIGLQGGEYLPGIRFYPTAGHSAGHMSIVLESAGEQAVFTGDVWHHPLQVFHPAWSSMFCADKQQAAVSRRWVLDYASTHQAHVFTPHFAGSSSGHVHTKDEGFVWQFA